VGVSQTLRVVSSRDRAVIPFDIGHSNCLVVSFNGEFRFIRFVSCGHLSSSNHARQYVFTDHFIGSATSIVGCLCTRMIIFERNIFDLDIWHDDSPSPYLGQAGRQRSQVKVTVRVTIDLKVNAKLGKLVTATIGNFK